jgi:hypothetical protein
MTEKIMFCLLFLNLRFHLPIPSPWERDWGEAVQNTNYDLQKFGRFDEQRKTLLKSI